MFSFLKKDKAKSSQSASSSAGQAGLQFSAAPSQGVNPRRYHPSHLLQGSRDLLYDQNGAAVPGIRGSDTLRARQRELDAGLEAYQNTNVVARRFMQSSRHKFERDVEHHADVVKRSSDDMKKNRGLAPDPQTFSSLTNPFDGRDSGSGDSGGVYGRHAYTASAMNLASYDTRAPRRSASHNYLRGHRSSHSAGFSVGSASSGRSAQPPQWQILNNFVPETSQLEEVPTLGEVTVYYDGGGRRAVWDAKERQYWGFV